ncbi:hypothetical protein BDW69DRAFT_126109 [Aspergillus filifer]
MPSQTDADPQVYELPAETPDLQSEPGPAASELPTDPPVSRLNPVQAGKHQGEILAARLNSISPPLGILKLSSNTPMIQLDAARVVDDSKEASLDIQLAAGELFEPLTVALVPTPPATTGCPAWDYDATDGAREGKARNRLLTEGPTTPAPPAYSSTSPLVAVWRPTQSESGRIRWT